MLMGVEMGMGIESPEMAGNGHFDFL